MKKNLILLLSLISGVLSAQAPSRFFTKFGGAGIDIGYSVKQTFDKGYIVAGSTTSFGSGATDVYLVKLDSMGWTTWAKTFGGFANDVARSVIQLADTGFVICGFTNSFGAGGYDAYLLRTDKNGTLIWQKTFGGADWDFAYDVVESADGKVVTAGSTASFGTGQNDGWIFKTDLDGTVLWNKQFGGTENDELNAIINTLDGSLAVLGHTRSYGEPNGDFYLIKLDHQGDTLFTRKFGGPGHDYGKDLIQKTNGDFYMVGAKTYTDMPYTQSCTYVYDMNGNHLNESKFNHSNNDESWVAVSDTYAGQNQTAFLRSVPVPSYKMQGNIFVCENGAIWPGIVNSFGGPEDEELFAIDRTKDGGYVCTGTTKSYFAVNGDVYLIKMDSNVVNYSSIVGLSEERPAEKIFLYQTGEGKFRLVAPQLSEVRVFDTQGRLFQNSVVSGEYLEIDLTARERGLFFFELSSPELKRVFKMIR